MFLLIDDEFIGLARISNYTAGAATFYAYHYNGNSYFNFTMNIYR
jgi:hypothetical protein